MNVFREHRVFNSVGPFFVGTLLRYFRSTRKEDSFTMLANSSGISLSASTSSLSTLLYTHTLSLSLSLSRFSFEYDYFHSSVEMDWSHRTVTCASPRRGVSRARTHRGKYESRRPRKLLSFVSNASSFPPATPPLHFLSPSVLVIAV